MGEPALGDGMQGVCDGMQGSLGWDAGCLGWDTGQFVMGYGAVCDRMWDTLARNARQFVNTAPPSSSGPVHLRSPVLGKNLP